MSPEQARGTTGRQAIRHLVVWRASSTNASQAIRSFEERPLPTRLAPSCTSNPTGERLPAETHAPTVHLLLRRCLAKDRNRRLRDIGDVKIELEAAVADPTASSLGLAGAGLATNGKTLLWSGRGITTVICVALVAVLVTIGATWSFWPTRPPVPPPVEALPPAPVERFMITLPQRESTTSFVRYDTFDVTDDGKLLTYMANKQPVESTFSCDREIKPGQFISTQMTKAVISGCQLCLPTARRSHTAAKDGFLKNTFSAAHPPLYARIPVSSEV